MASKDDISAMKLNAIVNRGSKKDFVDVFFLLSEYSMYQLVTFHNSKYPNQNELLGSKKFDIFCRCGFRP
jgi:predicted nucleotidyltransferase component of viral defense system